MVKYYDSGVKLKMHAGGAKTTSILMWPEIKDTHF
jgi:hypothetical protein